MKLLLSEEQANQLLGYLGNRPFAEVFQLIQMIQTLEKLNTPKVELPKKT